MTLLGTLCETVMTRWKHQGNNGNISEWEINENSCHDPIYQKGFSEQMMASVASIYVEVYVVMCDIWNLYVYCREQHNLEKLTIVKGTRRPPIQNVNKNVNICSTAGAIRYLDVGLFVDIWSNSAPTLKI